MIDWKQIIDLKDEIGDSDFDEVVPLFLEEASEIIERLKLTSNPDKLQHDLHSLKGSASNLGFTEFAMLCRRGENLAGKGDVDAVDVGAILISFDRSCQAFLDGLQHGQTT